MMNIEVNLEQVVILYDLIYREICLKEKLMSSTATAPHEMALLRAQLVDLQNLMEQLRDIEDEPTTEELHL